MMAWRQKISTIAMTSQLNCLNQQDKSPQPKEIIPPPERRKYGRNDDDGPLIPLTRYCICQHLLGLASVYRERWLGLARIGSFLSKSTRLCINLVCTAFRDARVAQLWLFFSVDGGERQRASVFVFFSFCFAFIAWWHAWLWGFYGGRHVEDTQHFKGQMGRVVFVVVVGVTGLEGGYVGGG